MSHLLPVYAIVHGGLRGGLHSNEIEVADEEEAFIVGGKIFALSAYGFLKNGGAAAKSVIDNYKPIFNREEYVKHIDSMSKKTEYPMESLDI
ncbi:MAG: hypothetical protein LUF35_04360 [Lachnospiraceae bacterium]|nr:hypothetical protein [Lachnospiraceae bacterium]